MGDFCEWLGNWKEISLPTFPYPPTIPMLTKHLSSFLNTARSSAYHFRLARLSMNHFPRRSLFIRDRYALQLRSAHSDAPKPELQNAPKSGLQMLKNPFVKKLREWIAKERKPRNWVLYLLLIYDWIYKCWPLR